jgi:hypothetical protein
VASVTGLDVAIKWPNDLLGADGRKLAGVLAETDVVGSPAGSALRAPIVVGIGINVNWPGHDRDLPTELVGSATSLRQQAGRPGTAPSSSMPCSTPSDHGPRTWNRCRAAPGRPGISGPGAPRSEPRCGSSWPTNGSRVWPQT